MDSEFITALLTLKSRQTPPPSVMWLCCHRRDLRLTNSYCFKITKSILLVGEFCILLERWIYGSNIVKTIWDIHSIIDVHFVFSVWKGSVQYFPSLKWQYFISVDGIHTEYPANRFQYSDDCSNMHDIRHRYLYITHIVIYNTHSYMLHT